MQAATVKMRPKGQYREMSAVEEGAELTSASRTRTVASEMLRKAEEARGYLREKSFTDEQIAIFERQTKEQDGGFH